MRFATAKANTDKKITGTPKSDLTLYNANSKLDADKDGIACELD
ncbi:excalibur calcium-binding domain-containing protein [Frondihabitans sp. PAMC 28766]|nr:excalibur calcium-binding domain-containing protein [Frondihabitans sp. PAMC 28766]